MSIPVRVLLVDDHTVVRRGLSAFLLAFDDLELAGEAGGGEDAIRQCQKLKPDVILMDLVMPMMDGAEATRIIKQQDAHVQIIALTSFNEKELVQKVLKAGAIGYLQKNVSALELAQAIRAAHKGRPTLSQEAAQALVQVVHAEQMQPGFNLTSREREVLTLMIEGKTNPEIAAILIISRSTVKFHVSRILAKLGASSRTEAVAMAVQHNLVTWTG